MKTAQWIDPQVIEEIAVVLRVLGHPHRLRIVELLMANRLTVTELAEQIDLPGPAVSQHLNHMKAHGILSAQRDGRTVYYRVAHPSAKSVIRCIYRNAANP